MNQKFHYLTCMLGNEMSLACTPVLKVDFTFTLRSGRNSSTSGDMEMWSVHCMWRRQIQAMLNKKWYLLNCVIVMILKFNQIQNQGMDQLFPLHFYAPCIRECLLGEHDRGILVRNSDPATQGGEGRSVSLHVLDSGRSFPEDGNMARSAIESYICRGAWLGLTGIWSVP